MSVMVRHYRVEIVRRAARLPGRAAPATHAYLTITDPSMPKPNADHDKLHSFG
jgi:hypothetical protein